MSLLIGSYHVNPASDFEESNPGLFVTWEDAWGGPLDVSLGGYQNSYGRGSASAFASLPFLEAENFEASVFGGLAHYPEDGRNFALSYEDVVVLGGLQLRWGPTFMQIVPGDGQEADAVVAFGISSPLGF